METKRNRTSDHITPMALVPPHSEEMEKTVLGTLLTTPHIYDSISMHLQPDDFYDQDNCTIYRAIQDTVAFGRAIDKLTVTDALRRMGVFGSGKDNGLITPFHLSELTRGLRIPAKVQDYVLMLKEKSLRRQVSIILGTAYNKAFDDTEDIIETIGKTQVELASLTEQIKSGNIKKLDAIMLETIADMEANSLIKGDIIGLPTGLKKMDFITSGFNPPDLIIIAAGTGEGKTTYAVNAGLNMAENKNPAAFFSLEMKAKQLAWKMIAGELGLEIKQVRAGRLNPEQWRILKEVSAPRLSGLPFYVYDVGGLHVDELKAIARTLVLKYGIKSLFVDYLQLVRGPRGKRFGTREEEVNFVSKEFKALAMELNIPIIALSQLNRPEKDSARAKRTYKLHDLRESGAIEQDADGVIFIWNPAYHGVKEIDVYGDKITFEHGEVLFLIEKWRLGETGYFKARFDGRSNRFSDVIHDPF